MSSDNPPSAPLASSSQHGAGPWHMAQVLDELWRMAPLADLAPSGGSSSPCGPRFRLRPSAATPAVVRENLAAACTTWLRAGCLRLTPVEAR